MRIHRIAHSCTGQELRIPDTELRIPDTRTLASTRHVAAPTHPLLMFVSMLSHTLSVTHVSTTRESSHTPARCKLILLKPQHTARSEDDRAVLCTTAFSSSSADERQIVVRLDAARAGVDSCNFMTFGKAAEKVELPEGEGDRRGSCRTSQ